MAAAVSIVASIDEVEEHFVLSRTGALFRVRDIGRDTESELDAISLIARLTALFDGKGSVFLAVIDHDAHALDIGFIARRYGSTWSDITSPEQPRNIAWQDVDSELWASLSRLAPDAPATAGGES